ncbi:hypothetical protein MKW92_035426 [Papaver armeniacum]|nr:hypothetical protein MKW92_035426 [Papaver armeniacum]
MGSGEIDVVHFLLPNSRNEGEDDETVIVHADLYSNRRYIFRAGFRSRMLYITSNSKVKRYLRSYFGVYSIRIENVGVRSSSSDNVRIHCVANSREFRKVVLTHLANLKSERVSRQSPSRTPRTMNMPSSGELILQKLECAERLEILIEEQKHPKSQLVD